jgi:hypothetical protein
MNIPTAADIARERECNSRRIARDVKIVAEKSLARRQVFPLAPKTAGWAPGGLVNIS